MGFNTSCTFCSYEIYQKFRNEWLDCGMAIRFEDYIDTLDLGIVSYDPSCEIYQIIDEEKWFLSKIKYGIH